MKKIRNYNTWNNTSYKERALYQVFENMTIRARNAGISNCILEEAKHLYKKVSDAKISRGDNRKGIIASCIYVACKKFNKCARSTKEIADIFQIESTNMTKGFKKFNEIMLTIKENEVRVDDYNISESIDFINRFCSNLNLEKDTNDLCKYVCKKIEDYDLVSENTPTSKAAGTIYFISYLFGLEISKKDISTVCLTSEVTISKCFGKLIDYYIYLLPENWLKYLAIDFIHKISDNIDKIYSKKIHNDFLKSSLNIFEKIMKSGIINDKKFITYFSAGVIHYQILKKKYFNISIKDICILYHMTESDVVKYYKKIEDFLFNIND